MANFVGLEDWAKKLAETIYKELGALVTVQITERFEFVFTGEKSALADVYIDILEAACRGKMTKRFAKKMDKDRIQAVIIYND